jgi:hypothetical protein
MLFSWKDPAGPCCDTSPRTAAALLRRATPYCGTHRTVRSSYSTSSCGTTPDTCRSVAASTACHCPLSLLLVLLLLLEGRPSSPAPPPAPLPPATPTPTATPPAAVSAAARAAGASARAGKPHARLRLCVPISDIADKPGCADDATTSPVGPGQRSTSSRPSTVPRAALPLSRPASSASRLDLPAGKGGTPQC